MATLNHKCDNCGKGIHVSPANLARQKNCYCSKKCREIHRGEMAWGAEKLAYVTNNCNHMTTDDMAKHFRCTREALSRQLNKWRSAGHDIPRLYQKKKTTSYKPVVIVMPKFEKKSGDTEKRYRPVTGYCVKTWVLR